MSLPAIVDAINNDFLDSGVPCAIYYGPDHLAEHNETPRIVVWPTEDTYEPPLYVVQYGTPMSDGLNPRNIMTRVEGGKAEIWASGDGIAATQQRSDYDQLHMLINQFILSLHRVNPGNYKVTGGSTKETTRVVRLGYVYTLNFNIQVPITDAAWPTETGVAQDSTVQMINPSDASVMAEVEI